MIISLRGTNGAGKSTIVREIMSLYWTKVAIEYFPDRRNPSGYLLRPRSIVGTPLFVPGHYEIANGGVDTLPSLDAAYELIQVHAVEMGCDVLYEGKNMSDGCTRLLELKEQGLPVGVVHLDIPVKKCVQSVRERGHKIKVETIERLAVKCAREAEQFEKQGVEVYSGDREGALRQVRRWLKV